MNIQTKYSKEYINKIKELENYCNNILEAYEMTLQIRLTDDRLCGAGKDKQGFFILIGVEYLDILNEIELKSVLGHEMAHIVHRDDEKHNLGMKAEHALEILADKRALKLGATKQGLIGALEKLHDKDGAFYYLDSPSHPSLEARRFYLNQWE